MSKFKTIICVLLVQLLLACGGGGSGGGNQTPPSPTLNLTTPSTITYGETLEINYTVSNVTSVSLSNISSGISAELNTTQRLIRVDLTENVTGSHSFTISYGNANETKERTVNLNSEMLDVEPQFIVNGVFSEGIFSLYAGLELVTQITLSAITLDGNYSFGIESTSTGIDAELEQNQLSLSSNEMSDLSIKEFVILSLTDSTDRTVELTIEVEFVDVGDVDADFFCFVGYCDEENPEPVTFFDHFNSNETQYRGHFRGIMFSEMRFQYRVPASFGIPISASASSNTANNLSVRLDPVSREIILNTNRNTNTARNHTINFTLRNDRGDSVSVSYIISLTPSRAFTSLRLVDENQIIFMSKENSTRTIQFNLPDDIDLGNNAKIRVGTVQTNTGNPGNFYFDYEINGNELTIITREDRGYDQVFPWYEHEEPISAMRLGLYMICDNCYGHGFSGYDVFVYEIFFHFLGNGLLEELENFEDEYISAVNYGSAFFEFDIAIHYLDEILRANNVVVMEKDEIRNKLSVYNNLLVPYFNGFKNTFLGQKGLNIVEGINSIHLLRQRGLNSFNFSPFKGLDGRGYIETRGAEDQLERYYSIVNNVYDHSFSNAGGMINSIEYKVEILNEYVTAFNDLLGTNYGLIDRNDLPIRPELFYNRYGFIEGNLNYGFWVDDVFVFNNEYSYLQGLNDLLNEYIVGYYN